MTPQPAGMVSCSHPLSSSLLISGSSSLSLSFLSSLSHARALAHALGLVTSRVLEDTIDTPTGSNGVLPSLFVSLSLSVFFSFCSRDIFDPSLFSRSLSLSRALALAPRLIHNCVIEDTINNPTCSNGVLPSRTPLTSQPAAMVSCRHPSFLSLSLCRPLFPSLVLSLSFILSLLLSRSFRTCAKPHQLVAASRTLLPRQLAGMVPWPHSAHLYLRHRGHH